MQGGTIDSLITGRENKIIAVLLGLCGIFIVVIAIFTITAATRGGGEKSYMSLNIAPSTARVKIGSDEYRNGVWEMPQGKYEAEISAEGFKTKNITIEVGSGTTTVFDYLVNNENGLNYAEKDAYDILTLRHIEDNVAIKEFLIKYDRKLEIKNVLPIAEYDYGPHVYWKIDDASYSGKCERPFCLIATVSNVKDADEAKEYVYKAIRNYGYEPSDYEVIYDIK